MLEAKKPVSFPACTHAPPITTPTNNPPAQQAAKLGMQKAHEHWRPDGEVQLGLRVVLAAASKAADAAQAARAKAQDLGHKLHAAALLVEVGSRASEGIRLAAPA